MKKCWGLLWGRSRTINNAKDEAERELDQKGGSQCKQNVVKGNGGSCAGAELVNKPENKST